MRGHFEEDRRGPPNRPCEHFGEPAEVPYYGPFGADVASGQREGFQEEAGEHGVFYVQKRKVIFDERSKPYIVRWGISYCARRATRLHPTGEQRPRIWIDASFINKHDTRGVESLWPCYRRTKGS